MHGSGELFAPLAAALGPKFEPCGLDYNTAGLGCYRALEDALRTRMGSGRRFVVLAESFSGPVALRLAAHPPQGLFAVVVVASFASNPRPALAPLSKLLAHVGFAAPPNWLIRRTMLDGSASSELVQQVHDVIACAPLAMLRARLEAALQVDVRDVLHHFEVPVLWVAATRDRLVPSRYVRRLLAAAPERLEQRAMTGPHLLLQRYPQDSARIIRSWLVHQSSKL